MFVSGRIGNSSLKGKWYFLIPLSSPLFIIKLPCSMCRTTHESRWSGRGVRAESLCRKIAIEPTEPWQYNIEFKSDKSRYHLFLERDIPMGIKQFPFLYEIGLGEKSTWRNWLQNYLSVTSHSGATPSFGASLRRSSDLGATSDEYLRLMTSCTWIMLFLGKNFGMDLGFTSPPQGMLQRFQSIIPPHWWGKLLPINHSPPTYALYVPTEGDKRSTIHSLPTKKLYLLFESRKKEPCSCAKRWEKVYGDNVIRLLLTWKHWHLLPYRTSHLSNFTTSCSELPIVWFRLELTCTLLGLLILKSAVHVSVRTIFCIFFSSATWMDNKDYMMNFPEDFLLGTTTCNSKHYLFNYVLMWAKF